MGMVRIGRGSFGALAGRGCCSAGKKDDAAKVKTQMTARRRSKMFCDVIDGNCSERMCLWTGRRKHVLVGDAAVMELKSHASEPRYERQ